MSDTTRNVTDAPTDARTGDAATAGAGGAAPTASRMTIEDVTRKVAALLKLAERAGSPEESAAAAAKASALMETYQIERAQALDDPNARPAADEAIADFSEGDAAVPMGDDGRPTERIVWWKYRLAAVIARAHGCTEYTTDDLGKAVVVRDEYGSRHVRFDGKRRVLCFVGRPSDVATVRYLLAYLIDQCNNHCDELGRGMGRTWRNNFRNGFVHGVARKLAAERENLYEEMRAAAEKSADPTRALARVENAIARVEQRKKEAEAWAEDHLSLSGVRGGPVGHDPDARAAGENAATSVRIKGARGSLGSGGST